MAQDDLRLRSWARERPTCCCSVVSLALKWERFLIRQVAACAALVQGMGSDAAMSSISEAQAHRASSSADVIGDDLALHGVLMFQDDALSEPSEAVPSHGRGWACMRLPAEGASDRM